MEDRKKEKKKIIHCEFSYTPVSRKYELQWNECIVAILGKWFPQMIEIYYLLTDSEVITGKSQAEALMYWPSDSEVNTLRLRSEISS